MLKRYRWSNYHYQIAPKKIFQGWNKQPFQNETWQKCKLQSSTKISNLDPFIDENEVLHVGGRIKRSNLNTEYMHPILLSGKGIVTEILVKWDHHSVGQEAILSTELRHLGIGLWKQIHWFGLSLLDMLDVDIYMERLENRKLQIFHKTVLAQNHPLGMLGLTCMVHSRSSNTERKWSDMESYSLSCTVK